MADINEIQVGQDVFNIGGSGDLPVMFNETAQEIQVGSYKNSLGLTKPVYLKSYTVMAGNGTTTVANSLLSTFSIDRIIKFDSIRSLSGATYFDMRTGESYLTISSDGHLQIFMSGTGATWEWKVSVFFTKSTDNWE